MTDTTGRRDEMIVVRALVREPAPDARAAHAERRLIRTIAEWTPGAGVDIELRSDAAGRRVHVELRPLGPVPSAWYVDVERALAPVADVARRRLVGSSASQAARRSRVAELAELVRDPRRAHAAVEEWPAPAASSLPGAPAVAWPTPVRDSANDLLTALVGLPGAFVRTLVAAPTPLERSMLHDDAFATWDRLAHLDLDLYLGAPVRLRTFVGVRGRGESAASLRAAVRAWGTGLVLRDADTAGRNAFDTLGADALAGHVRPETWALAALRLPSAGERPPMGIPSAARPVPERPLDKVLSPFADALLLGTAVTAAGRRVPVRLEATDLCRHAFVEGRSGTGKTSFLTRIVAELSQRGIGCTLIEHHGTGVDDALRALAPAAAERALVVRHGDPIAHGTLNLFAERDLDVREQTIAEFVELVQAIFDPRGEGIVGPRWRRWFSLLCEGVTAFFGDEATLLHVVSVASQPSRAQKLAKRLLPTHPDLARRLHNEVGALSGDEATNLPAWAVSKFQPLLSQRTMREIIGRPNDSVDVVRAIDERRTLLIDLAGTTLGSGSARMLGALWLLKHWVAMGRRADRTSPHVVIFDEAHLLKAGVLSSMLAEARKYGIGVVLAGQSIDALAPQLQAAVEGNVGSFFSFRLGLNTAPRASVRLAGWPVGELLRLPDLRAATTLSHRGVQGEPFLLTVTRPSTGEVGAAAQAAAVEDRCARMWATDAPVVTDQEVDAALAVGAHRGAASGAHSPGHPHSSSSPTADTSVHDELPAFVADWLDARTSTAG